MNLDHFDGMHTYSSSTPASFISRFGNAPGSNVGTGSVIGLGTGAFGLPSLCTDDLTALLPVPGSPSKYTMGGRFYYISSTVSRGCGFSFVDAAGNVIAQCALLDTGEVIATSNGAKYYSNALSLSGTSLGSKSVTVNNKVYYEFEVELTVGTGTSGALVAALNGNIVLNLQNIDTQGTAGSSIGYAGVIGASYKSGAQNFYEDVYWLNSVGTATGASFLTATCGPMGPRSRLLMPTSDGSIMQFTPSTGTSGYACVNGVTFNDTPYIEAGAAGDVAQFGLGTFSASNILGVQTRFVGHADDAGTVNINGQLIVAGAVTNGATISYTASDADQTDLYLTDPTTGAAWQPSRFSTQGVMQVGLNRTA